MGRIITPGSPQVEVLDLSKKDAQEELKRRLDEGNAAKQEVRGLSILLRCINSWVRNWVEEGSFDMDDEDFRPIIIKYAAYLMEQHHPVTQEEINDCMDNLNAATTEWMEAIIAAEAAEDAEAADAATKH